MFFAKPLDRNKRCSFRSAVHHILLEHCFYTAQHQVDDLLFYTNGSFMPRRMALLPDEVKVSPRRRGAIFKRNNSDV